jgi:hypothetical protein
MERLCIIYQVDFSNVKLPHLGMNYPSPNIFRHAGFRSIVVITCA